VGNVFWGNSFVQFLLAEVAEKHAAKIVTKAPETLDLNQVQSWVNGSIWALLSLNLIALCVFLISAIYPQWQRFIAKIRAPSSKRSKSAQKVATDESVPSHEPAMAQSAVDAMVSTAVQVNDPPSFEPAIATSEVPPPAVAASAAVAPSPPPAAEQPPPPPAFIETAETTITEEYQPPDIQEELDLPKMSDEPPPPPPAEPPIAAEPAVAPSPTMTAEAAPTPVVPAEVTRTDFDITEEIPPVPSELAKSNSLPDASVSDQTVNAPMPPPSESLKSIEETLNEALSGALDTTEEISIFDPSIIDSVLKEDQKK
jgi:hypothetical protein